MPRRKRYLPYFEKLQDVRWQKKRLKTLEDAKWKCEACPAKRRTLHVHHKRYKKGAEPWDYERNELMVLCEDCHEQLEERKKAVINAVDEMFPDQLLDLVNHLKCPVTPLSQKAVREPEEEEGEEATEAELEQFWASLKPLLEDK